MRGLIANNSSTISAKLVHMAKGASLALESMQVTSLLENLAQHDEAKLQVSGTLEGLQGEVKIRCRKGIVSIEMKTSGEMGGARFGGDYASKLHLKH